MQLEYFEISNETLAAYNQYQPPDRHFSSGHYLSVAHFANRHYTFYGPQDPQYRNVRTWFTKNELDAVMSRQKKHSLFNHFTVNPVPLAVIKARTVARNDCPILHSSDINADHQGEITAHLAKLKAAES